MQSPWPTFARLKLHSEFLPLELFASHIPAEKVNQRGTKEAIHCILILIRRVWIFSHLSVAFDYLGRKSNP